MKKRWFEKLADYLQKKGKYRLILDRTNNEPYMERYYLLFANRPSWFPFNIVLHKVLKSDPDSLHDHPWAFFTIVLTGGYWETEPVNSNWRPFPEQLNGPLRTQRLWRPAGNFRFRKSNAFHKLELDSEKAKGDTWTLFVMFKQVHDWGFINENEEWEQWETYLNRRY